MAKLKPVSLDYAQLRTGKLLVLYQDVPEDLQEFRQFIQDNPVLKLNPLGEPSGDVVVYVNDAPIYAGPRQRVVLEECATLGLEEG